MKRESTNDASGAEGPAPARLEVLPLILLPGWIAMVGVFFLVLVRQVLH